MTYGVYQLTQLCPKHHRVDSITNIQDVTVVDPNFSRRRCEFIFSLRHFHFSNQAPPPNDICVYNIKMVYNMTHDKTLYCWLSWHQYWLLSATAYDACLIVQWIIYNHCLLMRRVCGFIDFEKIILTDTNFRDECIRALHHFFLNESK